MHKSIHSLMSLAVEADGRGLFVLQASASLFFIVSAWFWMDGVENQDLVLLPVTAAIYHNGVEKLAMRWTFEMAQGKTEKRVWNSRSLLRRPNSISRSLKYR